MKVSGCMCSERFKKDGFQLCNKNFGLELLSTTVNYKVTLNVKSLAIRIPIHMMLLCTV